jgi:inositol phosphorylceramide synthase catalytic subunit
MMSEYNSGNKNPMVFSRHEFPGREIMVAGILSLGYLFTCYQLTGLNSEHFVLTVLCNTLYFASVETRKFILGFFTFVVFWIIFDSMKGFPNYNFSEVHIKGLYDAELRFFGISLNGENVTPGKYLHLYQNTFLDILCGVFYLCWIPLPLAFAGYLFYTDRNRFLQFSLTFLFINFIGFIIYYSYPAAPPWYVETYGFEFRAHTQGSAAALLRFDHFFNLPVFESIYSKSSNVFAAMPSLHSAYPFIVLYFGLKNRMGIVNVVFAVITAGIWLSAVYTDHHYVMDVLVGVICAVTGIIAFNCLLAINWTRRWFFKYLSVIE